MAAIRVQSHTSDPGALDDFPVLGNKTTGALLVESTASGAFTPITTSTLANVAASATSVTLQAANADRKDLILFNDSASRCLVSLNATASATNCSFPIAAGQTISLSGLFGTIYTGIVTGIWDAAVGAMRLTELS